MTEVVDSILDLLSETATFAREISDGPLANAAAEALRAMQLDSIIGQRESWVYQTIMQNLVETGALGLGVTDLASLRTHRPN
jgi:hypothetical protein